jgi:hypothetical protein
MEYGHGISGSPGLPAERHPLASISANSTISTQAKKRALGVSDDYVIVDRNCDQVRRKIRNLIDSGIKTKDFVDAINVSTTAYYRFMSQSGPEKGRTSDTFTNAMDYLQKLESGDAVKPVAKKVKTSTTSSSGVSSARPKSDATPASSVKVPTSVTAKEVVLPGEMTDSVCVYDTCDDVRRKINAHLQKTPGPQAEFLRTLMSQYHTQPKKIQSSQLQKFRSMKGPDAGNTSAVFYAAYVFFEKQRIEQGKPKSAKRAQMEEIYPGGMDLITASHKRGVWASKGSKVSQNQFGQFVIDGRVY